MRLSGRNLTETDEVKLGAYHTLELEPQRAFTLAKVPPLAANWHGLEKPVMILEFMLIQGRRTFENLGLAEMHRDAQLMPQHSTLSVSSASSCSVTILLHWIWQGRAGPEAEPKASWARDVQAVWDALDIERVKTACDPGASADLAAVLITVCQVPKPSVLSSLLVRQHGFDEW